MSTKQSDNAAINLADEYLAGTNAISEYSLPRALARGTVVEITEWVAPDIGFGPHRYRVRVILTVPVWNALLNAYLRARNTNNAPGRYENDIVWLAAQALARKHASRTGAANFRVHLPEGREGECTLLRVECFERDDLEHFQVTIGFPVDFTRLR